MGMARISLVSVVSDTSDPPIHSWREREAARLMIKRLADEKDNPPKIYRNKSDRKRNRKNRW